MNITKIISKTFDSRLKQIDLYASQASEIQHRVLSRLTRQAAQTEWGRKYDYSSIRNYEDFRKRVPIQTYEEIKPYVERLRAGEQNLLWPSEIRWFAKSSGTTNDKSKFLPVSKEALEDIHYRGGKDAAALYFRINPDSHFFSGKGLILGGSHSPNLNSNHSLVGDLSAILIQNVNPLINFIRVPSKKIALMSEWETKIEAIANSTIPVNVTSLSGVPSWMLVLIKRVLEKTGKQTLEEVWPNLELFIHGGINFTPYREQYKRLLPDPKMKYMETYNASEGFFGLQDDPNDSSMLLMLDYGVYYEFVPISELAKPHPRALLLEEVETGVNYALVISTNGGLWRYMIGDTIMFTSTRPYKFKITGRTKLFINAFGEELIIDNAIEALKQTCEKTGATVTAFTAAPVFMDNGKKGAHEWIIEYGTPPADLENFADILDSELKKVNSDYEAKRYKDMSLQRLILHAARPNLFTDWLKEKGKLGGQNKVPQLWNDRTHIDELLKMNS